MEAMPALLDDRARRLLRIAQRLKGERDQARLELDLAIADRNMHILVLELWLSDAITLAQRDEPERRP